jgi:hypothetical protein
VSPQGLQKWALWCQTYYIVWFFKKSNPCAYLKVDNIHVGRCSLETMNINGNTSKRVIYKRKENQKFIAQCVVDESTLYCIKTFNFFPNNSFCQNLLFLFNFYFLLFLFFCWTRAIRPLRVCECVVGAPLRIFLQFILFNFKELDELILTNDHVVRCFVLHGANKKTFLSRRWGKLIIDSIYWVYKARQLLFPWVL